MVELKTDIVSMTFEFALKVIELYKFLKIKNEEVLGKQLLRAGTSIGANVEEAQAAQSRKDFIAKMSIASKEARETRYWLKLLEKSNYLLEFKTKNELIEMNNSIINVISKIIITTKKNGEN